VPWVDGALLVDLWPELDLPDLLKKAWQPLIDHARNGPIEEPIRISYEQIKKLDREEREDRVAALPGRGSATPRRTRSGQSFDSPIGIRSTCMSSRRTFDA
jgi:hypothetical protein